MRAIRHTLALLLSLTALAGLSAQADTRAKAPAKAVKGDPAVVIRDSAARQAALKRSYELLRNRLNTLASRLESSTNVSDQDKAKTIRKALKAASDLGTEAKFESLVRGLTAPGADKSLDELRRIVKDNTDLRADLKKILDILNEKDGVKRLAERNKKTEDVLKQLKELRDRQARLQARTETGKADAKKLGSEQEKLTKETGELTESKADADGKPTGLDMVENKEVAEKARKLVEQAVRNQKAAEGKLGKGNSDSASDSQGAAVKNLDDAIAVLENELHQGRQEEREKKLRDLLARAKRMLVVQVDVQGGVEKLAKDVKAAGGKPALTHAARSNKLSDKEREVVKEAEGAMRLIKSEGEGSAVAFAEIFEQLSYDTATVMDRLGQTDVGAVTQKITDDVIETLKDVIKALEKELQDNENNNGERPPPGDGPSPRKPLVNLLQELKMVFAMQKRVGDRTVLYGKTYSGEQAPRIVTGMSEADRKRVERTQKEMKSLSARQDRIARVTKEISKKPEAQRLGR